MNTLPSRYRTLAFAGALSIVMWLTRGNHAISPTHLPDASWAIFFLVGFYFRERLMLPLFLAQAVIVDCVAINVLGVDNFCVTPAYLFLAPAYGALWAAGRWSARHFDVQLRNLPWFAAAAFAGTFVCELISSGSFYFLGGRFADTHLSEFGARLLAYFPGDLGGTALYLGCAALIHMALAGHGRSASHSAS